MYARGDDYTATRGLDAATFSGLLYAHLPNAGPRQQTWIREALTIAAYHVAVAFPVIALLRCDDAPQVVWLTEALALCWVHDARHYTKLRPRFRTHLEGLRTFKEDYWSFYRELLAYRECPTADERVRLEAAFDVLFARVTGYDELDARIAKTRANVVLRGLLPHTWPRWLANQVIDEERPQHRRVRQGGDAGILADHADHALVEIVGRDDQQLINLTRPDGRAPGVLTGVGRKRSVTTGSAFDDQIVIYPEAGITPARGDAVTIASVFIGE